MGAGITYFRVEPIYAQYLKIYFAANGGVAKPDAVAAGVWVSAAYSKCYCRIVED